MAINGSNSNTKAIKTLMDVFENQMLDHMTGGN